MQESELTTEYVHGNGGQFLTNHPRYGFVKNSGVGEWMCVVHIRSGVHCNEENGTVRFREERSNKSGGSVPNYLGNEMRL